MRNDKSHHGTFASLAAVTTVTAIVSSLGAPLVPSLAEHYDVSLGSAQWVLTATLVAAAAATPAVARWGSGRLRRPVVLGSLTVVLLGCVLSALPLGLGALIVGRACQGLGMAVAPLALGVARDVWTGSELASRLSLLSVAAIAGAGLGYPVTGLVAQHLGVGAAYWLGAALAAAALGLAALFLPRHADGVPQAVDLTSTALLALGTVSILLAISRGATWGWSSPPVVLLLACGGVLLPSWIARTGRVTRAGGQPLVDLRLARAPGLVGPHTVSFALAVGMYGLLTLVVLLVRNDGTAGWGLDRGAGAAGLVLVPYAVLSVVGSRAALRVSGRFGPHLLLPVGATVFASSMALLAVRHDSMLDALVAMAFGGLGGGFTFSSLPLLIIPHVPAAEAGAAMAFNQLVRYLGFAGGSAAGVALLEAQGGGAAAFRTTALALAAVCLASAAGALIGGRRHPGRLRGRRRSTATA